MRRAAREVAGVLLPGGCGLAEMAFDGDGQVDRWVPEVERGGYEGREYSGGTAVEEVCADWESAV